MKVDRNLIPLQNSHTTQHTNENGEKSEWSVEENITNNKLYKLPKEWDENTVFGALDFAKVFELNALNIGINFGVKKMTEHYEIKIANMQKLINGLENSNSVLASKLGKFIEDEEE